LNKHTLTEKFAQYLEKDCKRLPTIQSYVGDVDGFLAYLKQMGSDFEVAPTFLPLRGRVMLFQM